MNRMWGRVLGWLVCAATVQAADPAFQPGAAGEFAFDTGRFSGRLAAGEKSQGIISLIDKQTGTELTKGSTQYGLFSFYRLLSPDRRWGTMMWEWPKQAKLLPDGSVRIDWPAGDDHPADIAGIFRWVAPDTLEVEAVIVPKQDMPKLELFVGSYFKNDARVSVFTAPPRHSSAKPELASVDVTPMTLGTYCSFPKDLKAAQLVYDGRWEQGLHPVQWSISRYLAGPLAVRRDPSTGLSLMLMSRPEDCFAIGCSYNQEPPDGVAGHFSTYLSLFGRDIRSGETVRARARLAIARDVRAEQAIAAYEQYARQTR